MSPLVYRTPVTPPDELPVLSNRAIVGAAVVLLARPPRLGTVWVRLDVRKLEVDSTWPPMTKIRETGRRPRGVGEGRWVVLEPAPDAARDVVPG